MQSKLPVEWKKVEKKYLKHGKTFIPLQQQPKQGVDTFIQCDISYVLFDWHWLEHNIWLSVANGMHEAWVHVATDQEIDNFNMQ